MKMSKKGGQETLMSCSMGARGVTSHISIDDQEINWEYMRRIRKPEVETALKIMKLRKVVGPHGIPIEVWRCSGKVDVERLTNLFNKIWRTIRIPHDWRKNIHLGTSV